MEGFTPAQVKAAHKAYRGQGCMGSPLDLDLSNLVHSNSLLNLPITSAAVSHKKMIFCPHLPGVRGKTVRQKPERVETER